MVYTIPLKNGFEKTASRYSGAFSIMAKCTQEYLMNKFICMSRDAVIPPWF